MGNNYRGGYQIIDFSEYDVRKKIEFTDANILKNLIQKILATYLITKPLMLQTKNVSIFDVEIEYQKYVEDDMEYLYICKNGHRLVEINTEEAVIYIYIDKSILRNFQFSFDYSSKNYLFIGQFYVTLNENTFEILTKINNSNELTDDEKKTLIFNICGCEKSNVYVDSTYYDIFNIYTFKVDDNKFLYFNGGSYAGESGTSKDISENISNIYISNLI